MSNFSEYAAPLLELLKNRLFEWTCECERGFNFIKSKLRDPEYSCTHSLIARLLFIAMHLVKPLDLC